MKLIVLIAALAFSASLSASTIATEAFKNIITAGKYAGAIGHDNCEVVVENKKDSVTVSITTIRNSNSITLKNSATNYTVEDNGDITATESLNYPKFINGGTKVFNVVKDNDVVEFYLTNVLIDHQDRDFSTYAACKVQR